MKLTSQEEYGLRCLLQIARGGENSGLTIPVLSSLEGISRSYVAKLLRILRRGGYVKSARGQIGGYTLARPANEIVVGEVLALLGGRLYDPDFCDRHAGLELVCANADDCSIRSLWRGVQVVVDHLLSRTTLADLLRNERETASWVSHLVKLSGVELKPREVPLSSGK
ncbi:MAG: Rrf2 family transcriptional regulator [Acidobacteria bacterium]|nr:Rrf2 family transcriptional regulator [Acidobacteriota bacterium]